MKVIDVEFMGKSDTAIITVHFPRWFGLASPKVMQYRGSDFNWRDVETGFEPTYITHFPLQAAWIKAGWDRDEKSAAQDAR